MTNLMLVSDAPSLGFALRPVLAAAPGINVAGAASSEQEALDLTDEAHPDVVLLDLTLQFADVVRLTRALLRRLPSLRVLVLGDDSGDPQALRTIAAGAHGCVFRSDPEEAVLAAVESVAAGECWLAPCVLDQLLDEYRRLADALTPEPNALPLREHERRTLVLLASGMSNKEIARQQGVALSTVKNTLTAVFAKIGVRHRSAAAAYALTHGLASVPAPRPMRTVTA